jgi:hypothetical protein
MHHSYDAKDIAAKPQMFAVKERQSLELSRE